MQGVWLFGSFACGEAPPTSDIDLALLGAQAFDPVTVFDLGLTLGVLARRDVDLVDLRRAPLVLRKEIRCGGRLVAESCRSACERFTADSLAPYVVFRDELALANADVGEHRRTGCRRQGPR